MGSADRDEACSRVLDAADELLPSKLLLLLDGAITTAAISGDPDAALRARTAAQTLVTAAKADEGLPALIAVHKG